MISQAQKTKIFTVSEFTKFLNETISVIGSAWIEGEITNFKNWQDRWIFFSLKDEFAILDCNISKYKLERFGFSLEDGMKIRLLGVVELRKNGRFTINVEKIQLQGEGSLKRAYELLKKKFESEGLFIRKRPIPNFVQNIGVITSRSGVVLQDFRKNLDSLGFNIYFYDSRVEGLEAATNLVGAIKWFNNKMALLDVLVIIRGGGSLEDLQAFNNEFVGRAIFASEIPVICGIGHDVNVPIASLVADVSVSTPSMAAVIINKSWDELFKKLPYLEEKLLNNFEYYLEEFSNNTKNMKESLLDSFQIELENVNTKVTLLITKISNNINSVFNKFNILEREIEGNLRTIYQKIIETQRNVPIFRERIFDYFSSIIKNYKATLRTIDDYLSSVDPRTNLRFGYSIIFNQNGKVIKDASKLKFGEIIHSKLYKGSILSKVKKINKN